MSSHQISRREMLRYGLAAGSAWPLPASSGKERPNIVFLLTDDQRYDELGCTGHPVVKTPNIDAIARDGVAFRNFFVTTASCMPNRTNLMTGQWERCHTVGWRGGRALSAAQWANTLPAVLRRAGYFTGLIGKSNIYGMRQTEMDYYCGGDTAWLGFYPKETTRWAGPMFRGARPDTQIEVLGDVTRDFFRSDSGFYHHSVKGIREFFGRRPDDKPFFLYLCFNVPHAFGTTTMEQRPTDDTLYRTAYRDQIASMPFPRNYVAEKDVKAPKLPLNIYSGKQDETYNYRKTPEAVREQQVRICQTVSGVDRLLGEVRKQLARLGAADNTIIVYSSDNGVMHGEWGYGGKCLLYEPAIHVPLIVYDPRLNARGRQVNELAVSPDVAPTILDLCGLNTPKQMQGHSLVPLMKGTRARWREDFFCECNILAQDYPLVQAVRGKRWKYMRYWPIRPAPEDYREVMNLGLRETPIYEELYDLKNDPYENHNLAGGRREGPKLKAMRERCTQLLAQSMGRRPEDPLPSGTLAEWKEDMKPFYDAWKAESGM